MDYTALQILIPILNIKQLSLPESAAVGVLSRFCYSIKFSFNPISVYSLGPGCPVSLKLPPHKEP